jgi:hypothetical protein
MSFQSKLLATGLLTVSACGTIALFGSVPVIARILSPDEPLVPLQSQVSEQAQLQAKKVQADLYTAQRLRAARSAKHL